MAVQFPQEERDVHEEVGAGGHPLAHLYLHHPALRDAGAQPLHWRLRLVACHQVVKMKKQPSLNFYVNLKILDQKILFLIVIIQNYCDLCKY